MFDLIDEKQRKETTTHARAREAELAEQLPLGITNNCDQTNQECDMQMALKDGCEQAALAEFRTWYWTKFYPTFAPALGWIQEDGERVESRFYSEWKRGQFDDGPSIPMEDRPETVSPVVKKKGLSAYGLRLLAMEDEAVKESCGLEDRAARQLRLIEQEASELERAATLGGDHAD